MGKGRWKKIKDLRDKEANPCDKCPWKNEETCESCELKDRKARANNTIPEQINFMPCDCAID